MFWGVKRRCSNEGLRTFPYNFQVWAKHCFMCTLQRSCMHESSGFSCLSSSGRARFVCKIDVSVNVFCNLFKKKTPLHGFRNDVSPILCHCFSPQRLALLHQFTGAGRASELAQQKAISMKSAGLDQGCKTERSSLRT